MSEIIFQGNYSDFKLQMDIEIKEAAEGFVRIGYLLKVARDTNVLFESGYKSVSEFAKAEYGLSADVVSRYIAINDKYSENGYSDRLQDRYRAYGVAKLAEMLSLPDAIAEQIPPEMTKQEIRDIKRDLKEEQSITEIEVMLEPKTENEFKTNLEKTLFEYFRQTDAFKEYCHVYSTIFGMYEMNELTAEKIDEIFKNKDQIIDILAPNGMANIRARVPGLGRMMLVVNEELDAVQLTNMRSMEKEEYSFDDVAETFKMLSFPYLTWEKAYFEVYGEFPEKKEEIAPAQVPESQVNTRKNEPEEKKIEKVEVVPGVVAEVDIEKASEAALKETAKAEIEAIGDIMSKPEKYKEIVSESEENKEVVSSEHEVITDSPDNDTEDIKSASLDPFIEMMDDAYQMCTKMLRLRDIDRAAEQMERLRSEYGKITIKIEEENKRLNKIEQDEEE